MAFRTVRAQITAVGIFLLMAGETICRSAFKYWTTIRQDCGMAILTSHILVLALQVKSCQVVIKFRRPPAICSMAGFTICAKTSFMRFILNMA